jgi:oxygen-independent coproporphyrinogen-3 oxidase
VRKCAYCDFYSTAQLDRIEAYTNALTAQIRYFRPIVKNTPVDTVFIGGGTPSLLSAGQIGRILGALRSSFHVTADAEITMEANPGTLDASKLAGYHAAGVNRLSLGLQSGDDGELRRLSRIHTRKTFEENYLLARLEGFRNINVDLMYALPGQTPEVLSETVSFVTSLNAEHISFYGLKLEPETPFGKDPAVAAALPDEDRQSDMYLSAAEAFEKAGYRQYEISNFAKQGKECRHNLKYWRLEDYLGFGPAAYSFFQGKMFSYARDMELFIRNAESFRTLLDEYSVPSQKECAAEYVMLGFRLCEGIDKKAYANRFADDFDARYYEKMCPFLECGYIQRTKNGYRLSREGMLVSNYILSEILEF